MAEKLLNILQGYLKDDGMDCALFGGTEGDPQQKLILYMGNDSSGRERTIVITAEEQVLPANFTDFEHMQVETGYYRLEVRSLLPIEFLPAYGGNMASAVNFLNGMLEMPGLVSDEAYNQVFYKSIQIVYGQEFKKPLLIGIIGMHRLVLDIFSGLLEKIGTGEMSFLDMLDEIARITAAK